MKVVLTFLLGGRKMSYIYLSIAKQILVSKRRHQYPFDMMSMIEIQNKISHYFCIALYDCYENDKFVCFSLKKGILKNHLYNFLEEQSHRLFDEEKIRKDIEKIKNKDDEEILYMITNDVLDYFHYDDFCDWEIFYLDRDLNIYFEGINILSEGKVVLENYCELFGYIHDLIRKGSHNILRDTTYLHIS